MFDGDAVGDVWSHFDADRLACGKRLLTGAATSACTPTIRAFGTNF
jgi:hypothetical protein